ncbi:4-hydroxythreonine-4-phosphate dehydrogenase PdxA [Balneolaceae bacterium YR4-1]|uniref:4-hydroxythreonine-4-phosphate dehydrogenase PdxA n=1 Tax=Halalkalibaculum roseum TaxID=2709311 RepID=A0A6M1SUL4_9BACT|nr:4-hydroxythreonine-4-phosphate dehydrogenase PdxA [Halalkalibaculum roseum]NGP76492.1 4-hydroxythreonine-4-phosphate dehydrogenase PdxA [Halalkalibaculum roseum]
MPIRVAISIGDINGIGPEVALKSLVGRDLNHTVPVLLGNRQVIEYYSNFIEPKLNFRFISSEKEIESGFINVLDCYEGENVHLHPGELTEQGGKLAMMAIKSGIDLCLSEHTDALVTAPISKEAINKAGYDIPGHTEFLADNTGTSDYMMMLVNENLRVGLVSIHVPLSKVTGLISQSSVYTNIKIMHRSLVNDFNINEPDIAVLALNPHAGDGGIIGREEIEIIEPAIKKAHSEGISTSGPHPADGFFGNKKYKDCDGILAMYHDQGLIPFKTLSFGAGVNFTAGLPIIRTSPDHGTAFDIAGKNIADPSSFNAALDLALTLAKNRKQRNRRN